VKPARLASVYFAWYAGVGVSMAYFAPYLRGLGFDGKQIGAVAFAQQSLAVLAVLFWGSLGDRIGTRALRLATLGATGALAFLPFVRTPLQVGLVMACSSAFSGGIVPLVDAATVHLLGKGYARTRLWGSVGFIITAQGIGLLLAARGERPADAAMPLAYLICFAATALAALGVRPAAQAVVELAPVARPQLAEGFSLLRDRRVALLLLACALHWGANAPYNLLFGVLVREHGHSSRITGLGMALGVAAEVVALLLFPRLIGRYSLRALFAVAYLVSALRWVLVARAESAAALALLQLFHAATFGLWWGCAIEALRLAVPARLRASGQAMFSAVVFGSGNLLGYALSGAGYDRFGGAPKLFLGAAVFEVLALLVTLPGGWGAESPPMPATRTRESA
jgi:MFS transporter, PPP family, 3-phenylpropionic acid transporter